MLSAAHAVSVPAVISASERASEVLRRLRNADSYLWSCL